MKQKRVVPGAINVLRAYKTITGETIALPEIKQVLYQSFKETGVSLLGHNKGLWTSLTQEGRKDSDVRYPTIVEAVNVIKKRYRSLQTTIRHAKNILKKLKLLATADLFWDPVISQKSVKHSETMSMIL